MHPAHQVHTLDHRTPPAVLLPLNTKVSMPKPLTRRALVQSAAAGAAVLAAPSMLIGCAKTGAVAAPGAPSTDELLALIEAWAAHFGYYDGAIDLEVSDLSAFTTADCTLTAHAPLWGTEAGAESATPASEVRTSLAKMLRRVRITRNNMHMARHPDGKAICLFFVVKARLGFLPLNLMTVPLAFVANAVETDRGLRIKAVNEWPAETPEDARQLLVDTYGWPAETALAPHVAFGAVT